MSSLLFHDLPPGAVPLYIGEPAEGVAETGLLVLDHVGREVRFVKSDPFGSFEVPAHSTRRYSRWEIDAMMPRWQLRELYGEARPLLERIQRGTTMTRLPTHWDRTQTPEAQAASVLVDDLTAQPAEAAVDWVPAPRTVTAGWSEFEQNVRIFLGRRRQPVIGVVDGGLDGGHPVFAIGNDAGKTTASFVISKEAWRALGGKKGSDVDIVAHKGDVRVKIQAKGSPDLRSISPSLETELRKIRRQEREITRKARQGLNGQWETLFEERNTRRIAG
ncbi:hypothetical protein SAMN04488144_103291 [Methylobacterium sp. 190mf]|uniref:hypothetical protein n=1 Tax=Methylobacterium sp. 190mf TaxID=1761798 RepID=UPI00089EC6EC|nr:hypothetical protein [Methylobacterium sp. 190mf]SEF68676.1 hypothetical protein SAMN04488144_103291 [Methylobacterium sp. 190mf]